MLYTLICNSLETNLLFHFLHVTTQHHELMHMCSCVTGREELRNKRSHHLIVMQTQKVKVASKRHLCLRLAKKNSSKAEKWTQNMTSATEPCSAV